MAKYIVVTGAGKDTYWYADKIGEIFEVLNEGRNKLEVVYDDGTADGFYVNRDDCKEVDNILDLIANLSHRVSELEQVVKRIDIEKAAEEIDKAVVKKRQLTRDEIVRRAIEDVVELAWKLRNEYPGEFTVMRGRGDQRVNFVVNRDKRAVVALIKNAHIGDKINARGIAKCAPGDVFNAHIGRAIALRRALGLEVPAEYTNAPQPKKPRVGDVVKWTNINDESDSEIHRVNRVDDEEYWLDEGWDYLSSLTVIDDTESTEAAANAR